MAEISFFWAKHILVVKFVEIMDCFMPVAQNQIWLNKKKKNVLLEFHCAVYRFQNIDTYDLNNPVRFFLIFFKLFEISL